MLYLLGGTRRKERRMRAAQRLKNPESGESILRLSKRIFAIFSVRILFRGLRALLRSEAGGADARFLSRPLQGVQR